MKNFLLILALSLFSIIAVAQDAGTVTYEMDMKGLDESSKAMMGDIEMTLEFEGDNTRMSVENPFINTTTFLNAKTDEVDVLMDMMGNKIHMNMNIEDYKAKEGADTEYEIILKDDIKEIADFDCKRALVKSEAGTIEVYYTEEIKGKSPINHNYPEITGFPLQFESSQGGQTVVFKAIEVDIDDVDDERFVVNKEGYTSMDMKDLQKMMGSGF